VLTYFVAFAMALVVSAVLTPLVTALAHRFRLFDIPDQFRKIHVRAVPRLGGIAVVIAFFTPIFALVVGWSVFQQGSIAAALAGDAKLVLAFALGSLAIVALGVFDDLKGADAKLKFAVQIAVASAMYGAGFRIEHIGGSVGLSFDLGLLSFPLTIVWIVGVVNAVNLIDGLDGLASGIALTATLTLLGVALINGEVLLALFMTALAGSLVGFLFFNFNPARIFLGDSGSLFLGFVLAITSVWTQQKAPTAAALTWIPLFALAVPLLDTTLCIVRRVARGQSPFSPDREHLHHRLMALGHSHRSAVLTLYAVAFAFAFAGIELLDPNPTRRFVAVVGALIVGGLLVRRVGLFGAWPPAGHEVLTRARDAALVIRQSKSMDTAWQEIADVLPALGCEEATLTLILGGANASTDRTVFSYRNAAANDDYVTPSKDRAVFRMTVGAKSGELIVLLDHAESPPPMRAAYKKALKSLHAAIHDVALETEGSLALARPWIANARAGRPVLD